MRGKTHSRDRQTLSNMRSACGCFVISILYPVFQLKPPMSVLCLLSSPLQSKHLRISANYNSGNVLLLRLKPKPPATSKEALLDSPPLSCLLSLGSWGSAQHLHPLLFKYTKHFPASGSAQAFSCWALTSRAVPFPPPSRGLPAISSHWQLC